MACSLPPLAEGSIVVFVQLTRENIVAAAVEILDTYGLADMTMRRLAKHLEVVPGALYWHIPNKQSLIEAIAEEILQPVWRAIDVDKPSVTGLCELLRGAMIAHRDGAEVVGAALPVGDITARITAGLVDALRRDNLPEERTLLVATTLINFILGATSQEQSRQQLDVALDRQSEESEHSHELFTAGLELILNGAGANRSVE